MSLEVLGAGFLTTLQDLGRYGLQKYGISPGGAMDPLAHRLANLLVGNSEEEATLEITLQGPALRFHKDTLFAIGGGDLSPMLDGISVPLWRGVLARKGRVLRFGNPARGCRAYLAVAGGFGLPRIMGSKSTYLRAGLGGYHGRALAKGDILPCGEPSPQAQVLIKELAAARGDRPLAGASWTVTRELLPEYGSPCRVRVIRGKEFDLFTEESRQRFLGASFQITPQSDRMGYRLTGPGLRLSAPREFLSEAVALGTVQVTPDGNPVILMADRQTTGGYPKIGQIASVDLPLVAQAKPGDWISFREISLEEAQRLYLLREKQIHSLKLGISLLGK